MEALITAVISVLIELADKFPKVALFFSIVGLFYTGLLGVRPFLRGIVKLTKTEADNKIVDTIYALLDKYGPGFGPLKDYSEKYLENLKNKAETHK